MTKGSRGIPLMQANFIDFLQRSCSAHIFSCIQEKVRGTVSPPQFEYHNPAIYFCPLICYTVLDVKALFERSFYYDNRLIRRLR